MNPPDRHLPRWGTVRLRMTLWNVAVLALILGALGGVEQYNVQADRTVYSTIWELGTPAGRRYPVRVLSMPIERQGKVDRVLYHDQDGDQAIADSGAGGRRRVSIQLFN